MSEEVVTQEDRSEMNVTNSEWNTLEFPSPSYALECVELIIYLASPAGFRRQYHERN